MGAQAVALDTEHARELGGVEELPRRRWLRSPDQLDHAPRKLLDVGRVKPHELTPLRETRREAVRGV